MATDAQLKAADDFTDPKRPDDTDRPGASSASHSTTAATVPVKTSASGDRPSEPIESGIGRRDTPQENNHYLRCLYTADMAFQLIAHLAGRGVKVEKSEYDKIHRVTRLASADNNSGQNFTAEIEHEFWDAYANIVQKINERDEDPEGIYYTAMFERPNGRVFSKNSEVNQQWLRIYSRGIAFIAMSVLTLLVLTLAYGTAVNNMLVALTSLSTEELALRAGQLSGTRLEGISDTPCAVSSGQDLTITCQRALSDIGAARNSATELLYDFMFLGLANGPEQPDVWRIQNIAQQIYIFLSDYIYPLLAGALGACVSLLRAVFAQLREKRLHLRVFKSAYLRIAVGTIAGIVIGWVGSNDAQTGISLTPLALAFAAGYAVEIIYNLLDRFVIAFSQPIDSQIGRGQGRGVAPGRINEDANVHKDE